MKNSINDNSSDYVHKDVVIIGNGPSGLALSYMLSGNIPYLISRTHPDELLSARLSMIDNPSLVHQDLGQLAAGLEGRSTNPISLLLDALSHPYADMGLELDPLIEWHKDGIEIDHIVLGKGPPGGSWHKMDPHILTLSLGSWMALPGLNYTAKDGSEKRASAGNVAQYYVQYMNEMKLQKYFRNGVYVTKIEPLSKRYFPKQQNEDVDRLFGEHYSQVDNNSNKEHLHNKWVERVDDVNDRMKGCLTPETEERAQNDQKRKKNCSLSNAFSFIRLPLNRKCKRRRDVLLKNESNPDRKFRGMLYNSIPLETRDNCWVTKEEFNEFDVDFKEYTEPTDLCRPNNKARSISFSCDYTNFDYAYDNLCSRSFHEQGSYISSVKDSSKLDVNTKVPVDLNNCGNNFLRLKENCDSWLVETYETITGKNITYICKHLVLANGANDLPNKLTLSNQASDPFWVVYDVRSLEMELDLYILNNPIKLDPVLIVGAGLSAADAIIATRCRNIPVVHVFRNKTNDLSKQLPENMYPEYHKVHQMMQDGGSSYSLYEAIPECVPVGFNESERTVTLQTKSGDEFKYHISFAAILIGARPDLNFVPSHFQLGIDKKLPVDSKTNNIDINKLTHSINGFDNLYAMGPLVGDNFVRFIPGGALAIVSDLYKKYGY